MDIDKLFLSGLNYKTEGVENIYGYVEQRLVKESELTEEHQLQNKIIDMYLALLIDKKDNGGPRNVQILHRSIDNDTDLAKSVLKDIEGSGKSKTESPYSFYSLARQTASKNDYITGKVGIGPFALNNNNQILTMIYHISFRESQSSLLSTLGLSRLDKQLDVDGNSIMSWISAMINAHVDIAKDPWISRLNVNPFSYNITNLLLRTGWGGNTFYFLTQPIMKQMADAYVKASSQYMQQNGSTYSRQQQSIKDVAEQYFGKDVTFDGNTLDDALSLIDTGDKESIQAINEAIKKLFESEQFKQDARDYAQGNDIADQKGLKSRQLGIYLAYVQFSKYANALANLVKYCKIDTKKHGKSAAEQLVYKEGFDELFEFATDEDGVLIKKGDVGALFEPAGLLDLVEHSYVGTKTRNAISLTKAVLGKQFMSSTPGFIQMLRQLNTMAGNTSLSVSFAQSAQKALSAAIKSQFFNDYVSRISDNPRYMHDLVNSSSEDLEFSYDASTNSMSITGNKHSLKSYVGQPILLWYKDKDGNLQQYIPRDKNGNALPLKVLTAKDDKIQLNISINGNFNGVCRLLGGANTIFDRLSRLKPMIYHNSDYSDLQGNLLLEMLIPGKRVEYSPKDAVLGEHPDTYDDLKFVKLQNFVDDGGINTNYIINAWNELLEYQNDKQPQVAEYIRNFARDLVVYAFITSGDTQGFTKMFKYVPASWRKKSGYADFINRKLEQLTSYIPTVDLNDVLLNNWYDNKLVPTYQFYSKDANGKRSSNFIGVAKMNSVNGNKQTLSAYPTILAALKKNDEGMYEPSIAVESSPKFIKIPRSYNHYDSQRQYNVYQLYGFARHNSGIMYPVYVLVQPKGTKVSGGFMVTEYGRNDSTQSSTEYVVNQGALRAFVESADFINQLPAIKKNFGDEYAAILNDLRTEQTGGVAAAITDDDQAQPVNTGNQPSTANKTQQQTQSNDKPGTTQPQTSTPTSTNSSEKSVTEQLVQHLEDSGFTVYGIDKNDIEKNEDYQFAIEQPNAITTADNTSGTNSDVMTISRSRLINAIASTHRQLKQIPKRANTTRYGADNIYYQLRKALPKEIAGDIIKFYNEEKDRESFLDRVQFYINNELKQSVLPKAIAAAKNRQLGFSTRYDARNITAQLFGALKSGKITGNVETDTTAIGRYQTWMAQQLFPAIYYKGWSKQRYGYYAKSFSDISKKIQVMVRLYNNASMGNINHIYKLEAVLEGLKNHKFKQHLIEYITAVDRTTQRNNPNIKRSRVRDKVFKLSPLVLTFKDKQKRSLKEVLSDIKQRTSVYDDIIDTILSKMRGDTTIQLNSHNRPQNVLGSTISYPHKPSISIVRLTTTNKDEFELINTIIHETIHVITLQYLHDNPRTTALLDEYAKYLRFKEGLEEGGWYGNKNAKEMIAEFFSNAEYREWLKTVPAQKLKMSMFDKIVDFIARIFTGKSKTAYEQLKPTFDYILDEALSSTTVSEFTDFFDELIQSSDMHGHDGAFLSNGDHFLVRSDKNQIKPVVDISFSRTNNNTPFFKDSKGVVYGYVDDAGIIHLNKNKIKPEHPIHEYTHIWDRVVAMQNPSLWIRGVELMKQFNGGKLWNEIANSEFYGKKWSNMSDAQREFMIASEVHARLVGESGAKLISEIEAKQGSSDIISKLKDWILKFWQSLKQTFSNWSYADIETLTLKDFNHMPLRDFVTSSAEVAYNESDAYLPLWNKLHITGFVEHDNDIELSDDVQRAIDKIKAISPNEQQYITPVITGETFITGVSLIDAINIAAKIFNADDYLEVSDKILREKVSQIVYSYDREALFNLLSFGTVPNGILLMLADYMNYDDARGLVAHYIGFELQKRCQKKSYDDVAIPIIKSIDVKYDDSRQQSLFNDDIMKHCKGN